MTPDPIVAKRIEHLEKSLDVQLWTLARILSGRAEDDFIEWEDEWETGA